MKRAIAVMLAILLLSSACAALAEGGKTFSTDYYTLTIPQDWEIDTSDLDAEDDYRELGTLLDPSDPGLVIEAGLVHYDDLSDISLWNADDKTMQDYIDAILEELEDDKPEYVSTLKAGSIPFVVFKAENKDGPYHYIDTMTNGYAVVFYAYVAGTDGDALLPMSDEQWAQIEAILTTFRPAG